MRPVCRRGRGELITVSIHALLAECDFKRDKLCRSKIGFNPRTPCGVRHDFSFQPNRHFSFNPRTPCGVRRVAGIKLVVVLSFNPRTPCGVRPKTFSSPPAAKSFQSTHSLRSATGSGIGSRRRGDVSIHALLAECDRRRTRLSRPCPRFNPRTPCGVRH